jgi:hypothetical protein
VWVGVGSWVGGHGGSCFVPSSGREANRVRLPGYPFATHLNWVVGMERYGHSRAGLNPGVVMGELDVGDGLRRVEDRTGV